MISIETCLSPKLIHLHSLEGKVVVIIDIFRATSCMVTALANGAESIYPVNSTDECANLGKQGYLTAAERGGRHVEGFDFGNSPIPYTKGVLSGKRLAMTTTNGTLAISESTKADQVIIGSFLNINSVVDHLIETDKPIIFHCAGWKGHPNLEDTVYAGACIELISQKRKTNICDSSVLSVNYNKIVGAERFESLKEAAHVKRLIAINPSIFQDVEFCLRTNMYEVLPILNGQEIRSKT